MFLGKMPTLIAMIMSFPIVKDLRIFLTIVIVNKEKERKEIGLKISGIEKGDFSS